MKVTVYVDDERLNDMVTDDYRTAAIKKYVYGKDKDKVIDNAVRIAEQKYLNGELKIPTKLT